MNIKAYVFASALLAVMVCAVCAYSHDVEEDLEKGIVRLHIIAESDSERDQEIKLKVRDAVLEAAAEVQPQGEEELTSLAERTAEQVLMENNCSYGAHAEYGSFQFPERSYRGITLPAGRYNGIRVVLGSGSGRNWWCVMYPPLCVTDGEPELSAEGEEVLRSRLRADTYDIISEDQERPVIKFRIIEAARAVIGTINSSD